MEEAYSIEEIVAYYTKEIIPYKELEKNPSKYAGTSTSFTGKVLQIQEELSDGGIREDTVLRLALNGEFESGRIHNIPKHLWNGRRSE